MQISVYHVAKANFSQGLKALDIILDKASAFAEERKIDPSVLINARLAPDMFPLSRQVQIACDFVKSAPARLTGVEMPKYEDNETTFAELKARVAKCRAYFESFDPAAFAGSEDRQISFQIRDNTFEFTGLDYLCSWVQPNFYFHLSMVYAILRHNGIEIGKGDFLARS